MKLALAAFLSFFLIGLLFSSSAIPITPPGGGTTSAFPCPLCGMLKTNPITLLGSCSACQELVGRPEAQIVSSMDPNLTTIESNIYYENISNHPTRLPINNSIILIRLENGSGLDELFKVYSDNNGVARFNFSEYSHSCLNIIVLYCPFCSSGPECGYQQCLQLTGLSATKIPSQVSDIPTWPADAQAPAAFNPDKYFPTADLLSYCPPPPPLNAITIPPLCIPLLLIISLLMGAMYVSGRNPFSSFNLASPRVGRHIRYQARGRGFSMNLRSIWEAVNTAKNADASTEQQGSGFMVDSVRGASKGVSSYGDAKKLASVAKQEAKAKGKNAEEQAQAYKVAFVSTMDLKMRPKGMTGETATPGGAGAKPQMATPVQAAPTAHILLSKNVFQGFSRWLALAFSYSIIGRLIGNSMSGRGSEGLFDALCSDSLKERSERDKFVKDLAVKVMNEERKSSGFFFTLPDKSKVWVEKSDVKRDGSVVMTVKDPSKGAVDGRVSITISADGRIEKQSWDVKVPGTSGGKEFVSHVSVAYGTDKSVTYSQTIANIMPPTKDNPTGTISYSEHVTANGAKSYTIAFNDTATGAGLLASFVPAVDGKLTLPGSLDKNGMLVLNGVATGTKFADYQNIFGEANLTTLKEAAKVMGSSFIAINSNMNQIGLGLGTSDSRAVKELVDANNKLTQPYREVLEAYSQSAGMYAEELAAKSKFDEDSAQHRACEEARANALKAEKDPDRRAQIKEMDDLQLISAHPEILKSDTFSSQDKLNAVEYLHLSKELNHIETIVGNRATGTNGVLGDLSYMGNPSEGAQIISDINNQASEQHAAANQVLIANAARHEGLISPDMVDPATGKPMIDPETGRPLAAYDAIAASHIEGFIQERISQLNWASLPPDAERFLAQGRGQDITDETRIQKGIKAAFESGDIETAVLMAKSRAETLKETNPEAAKIYADFAANPKSFEPISPENAVDRPLFQQQESVRLQNINATISNATSTNDYQAAAEMARQAAEYHRYTGNASAAAMYDKIASGIEKEVNSGKFGSRAGPEETTLYDNQHVSANDNNSLSAKAIKPFEASVEKLPQSSFSGAIEAEYADKARQYLDRAERTLEQNLPESNHNWQKQLEISLGKEMSPPFVPPEKPDLSLKAGGKAPRSIPPA